MIIQFPDGTVVDTISGLLPFLNRPTTVLSFISGSGSVAASAFTFYNLLEGVTMLQQIQTALKNKVENLVLTSSSPLPTSGNATGADMYVNSSNTLPAVVTGGSGTYLTVGASAASFWPPLQSGPAMLACFRPDGMVTIGGQQVTQLEYVNGVTLLFNLPYLPPGTYDLTYTDSRGSVSKLVSVQY